MSNIFVRSSDGNNADNGSTWALAKATLAGADGIDAAGDTIYVSKNHVESTAAGVSLALAGSLASPTRLLCVDDTGDPASPTTLATTAQANLTTAAAWSINGNLYCYGIKFKSGDSSNCPINLGDGAGGQVQVYEKCQFIENSGNFANIVLSPPGNNDGNRVTWRDCDVSFTGSNGAVQVNNTIFHWHGGTVLNTSSASMTALFRVESIGKGGIMLIDGVDMSNIPASSDLVSIGASVASAVVLRNCKLPASWSGNLVTSPMHPASRCEMHNCDAGDTNYRIWIEDYAGSIKHETTLVRTGGASDGTTGLSWKMATNANAQYPLLPLRSPEIVRWNETVGSAITVDVDILHDTNVAAGQGAGTAFAFQDDEVWLEVEYLGTSGVPLASFVSDAKASVLATAADQTTSSSTWAAGLTTPVKQKLSVTFTPQEKGYLHAVVYLAKASKTIYVDPKLQVS